MKKMQSLILFLAVALMGFSVSLHAEDTDIYVDNPTTAGVPNILLVLDTSASFSADADPCTYASGGAPSLGNKAGGVEQCALVDAIESLPDSAVNLGILVTNTNGFATDTRSADDLAYHETCSGNAGGCVVRKLTLMNAASKTSLINFIKSWKMSGSNSATEFNVKSSTTRTGGMMQEAWAYYHGKIGQSGTSYADSIVGTGCQKNFVIFIGNAFGNSGTPGDGTVSPYSDAYGMTSSQVGATADQKIKISEKVNFSPPTCGVTSILASTNTSDWSENWADEWARLMFQQDGGTATQEGNQNIITYSIGVVSPTDQCKPDYPALLTTMAKYGGGKYFRTGDASALLTALATILNEVQAVNSVFSSASLPVSVNAEGTYLNQIYLGMFRPDSTGAPRWLGNLKQYQAIKTSSGDLAMGDASTPPKPAISSAGTGFISPNAVSFWTKKDVSKAPDAPAADGSLGGFYRNDKKGVPLSGYDSPDGEVVEKGGVAQQLRLESLIADFSATAGGTSNPRRLYTYCPKGIACNSLLTHNTNEFSTANSGIESTAFRTTTTASVDSIVRTGTNTYALVTTIGNHGFATGTVVTISNATPSGYNVTQAVTVNSSTTFTITGLSGTLTSPATGSAILASGAIVPDRDTLIKWVRGADNYGDEKGPGGTVTVRPSVHGDVLHSRPLVINYGDSRGIVVFYGSNDGVFRAVNGNQTAATGAVPAGGELWGLVLPEHYDKLNRQRVGFPELKFPGTFLASAQPKDYFVDGPSGAYQKLDASGKIEKSYLYLTMRRGGRFIYALDVTTPTAPTVLWKIDTATTGFAELGQTWSRPRVTLLERSLGSSPIPVLIFGAGYDAAEDTEPPGTDSMGRGIYVINALTGALIWSANSTCTTSATCLNVPLMKYAIPSEIAFVDRNGNGYTDKLYFADLGGNIWRADVNQSNTADWTVTKLAALGCDGGVCSSGTTPRKFFFPPSVLTIREGPDAYEAISIASGDREHPLKSTSTSSSYYVHDKFFMIMDRGTTLGGPTTNNVTMATLKNATSTEYDGTLDGFYINFATGEKAVNAPIAINGFVYFATNRPIARTSTCVANLGEAKAYAVSPFLGTLTFNVLPGGGLSPSAVTGLITVDGSTERFCIGCGISTPPGVPPDASKPPCNSALEICTPSATIPKNVRRSYWYKK